MTHSRNRPAVRTLLCLGAVTILASCGGSGSSSSSAPPSSTATVTAVSVAPQSLTLLLNSTQQFDAVATYSDGSVKDVTTSASWQSSASSVASVSSSGIVSGESAGSTTISASFGGTTGSASTQVSSASSGVTLVNDTADTRLMQYRPGDGSIATFYGARTSDGSPAAIQAMRVTNSAGATEEITFDTQGRPSVAIASGGAQFAFDWSAPHGVTLVGLSADRTAEAAIVLPALSSSPSASAPTTRTAAEIAAPSRKATNAMSQTGIFVHVTSCGGTVPEDDAVVMVTKSGLFGGDPVPALSLGPGTGEYQANLPAGPSSSSDESSMSSALGSVCSALGYFDYSSSRCAEFAVPELVAACTAVLTSLDVVCKAKSTISGETAVIDFLNSKSPSVDVSASATVDGQSEQSTLNNQPPSGPYPSIELTDFSCPKVDHIVVAPASATIGEGSFIPVQASAVDANGDILTSSAIKWAWNVQQPVAHLALSPGGIPVPGGYSPVGPGVSDVNVSGLASTYGVSLPVTATEMSSGLSGSSAITVTANTSLTITWTVVNLGLPNSNGWSGTDTLTISNGNFVYSGQLVNQGGTDSCVTDRTESASGQFTAPVAPADLSSFTFNLQFGASWTNTEVSGCGPNNGTSVSGGTYSLGVTIIATPTAGGGYSLSTNTTYAPEAGYGGSQVTVTASGTLD